jgi:hypothetical protein
MARAWGYLRKYTRWDGSPGLSLKQQKKLVAGVLKDIGYQDARRRFSVEQAEGNSLGWPRFQAMIDRFLLVGDHQEDVIVIPTLDGIQYDLSFFKMVMSYEHEQLPICIRSGWRRVGVLCDYNNHKDRSVDDIWKLASCEDSAAFKRMVDGIIRRRRALSKSIKTALQTAAAQGRAVGAQRQGAHRFTRTQHQKGGQTTARKRRADANRPYQQWIRAIAQKHSAGWSTERISRWLTSRGARKPDGSKISRMMVWRILSRMAQPTGEVR